ncbi:MAG: DUF368 domain-containing protein [Bacteroidota bacterium]
MRTIKDYLMIAAKGFGMGSADVVPGVSGGTIAFVTGIYEELIDSIRSIDLAALKVLRKDGLAAAWKHINGNFLVAVFAGVLISIFSLAKGLSYLLDNYPVPLWAFFFGLIISSAIFVGRQVKAWDGGKVATLLIGGAIAFGITMLTKVETPHEWWFVFIAGAVAICAMILPGISGSFILVIMGQYAFILNAIKEMDFKVIVSFAAGAVIGLLSFSRVISWLFKKYHDHTIAILTGFMIGSLNKVWPWKSTVECYLDRHGEFQPLAQQNVLPGAYEAITPVEATQLGITEKPSMLLPAIGTFVVGFILVFALERFAPPSDKKLSH